MLIDFFLFLFLSSRARATHFAAGSLQFKKDENGVLWVERTMGWRRGKSGWGSGCVEADLNKLSGSISSHENRYLPVGETDLDEADEIAEKILVRYTLLQIEDNESLTEEQHYCYGKTFNEALPAAITDNGGRSFTMTNGYREEGNTLSVTHDNGASKKDKYQYTAHIYTYDNNTPRFETPAIWWIMEGCSGQTYYITPADPDGNTIKCRWSTIKEASFMAHDKTDWDNNDWPMEQLSLDEVGCSVTYHPEFDPDNYGGNKAIAVQVEDFDENGVILSSVPCVFFARVFEPHIDPNVLDNPFVATNRAIGSEALEDHRHDEHEDDDIGPVIIMPRKLIKTSPAHCHGLPVWIPPTPPNESLLTYEATVAYYQVWAARFELDGTFYTTVNRAQFSLPDGMICSELRSDGTATCTWTPTADQVGLHSICGLCYDVFKRPSARNCVNIEVIQKLPPVQDPCEEIEKVEMTRNTFSSENIQSRTDLIRAYLKFLLNVNKFNIREKISQSSSDFTIVSNNMFIDYKIVIHGDRDISDFPNMIDGKTRTTFQFDQACGIQETPQKIEIFLTKKWDSQSSKKILFDLLELEISHEMQALPGIDISDEKWNHLPSNTATFRFEEIYLHTGGEQIQAQIFPNQPGKLIFKSPSGPIITSKMTINFPSKHIKISKLRFFFFTCGFTGYINPSITTGTFVDPKSDTHPVCYEYDGSESFDEEVFTDEYWNEAHLPGFYNPVADSHPERHYNFVVVKKKAGEFSSFDEVKQACSSFGMSLVYPYNAEANAFWLQRLQEQQAVTPGLELMIGLIHTLYSTSTGALVPSESALPLTNDVNVPNGYINFDDWDYDQVFFRLNNGKKQFFMDSVTGEWSQSNNIPAGMDATFCFKTKEITATCSPDLCQNTDAGEYKCVCPDDGSTLVELFGVQKCDDPSPCDVRDLCVPPAVCKNVFDSSICECPDEGVSQFLSIDGRSCESIDPCDTGLHNCDHPSLECISSGSDFSCSNRFECPCNLECSAPPCMSLLDCTVPAGGVDCGGDFDCSIIGKEIGFSRVQAQKESWYLCPIGKEGDCTTPDECEFDCKKLGPGWDCLKDSCRSYEDCSFDCLRIEDKKCPVGQSCVRNEDCCPTCSLKSGMGGSNFFTQIFQTTDN